MDDKVIFVEPKDYEGRALAEAQAHFFGKPVLSIERDLKLVEQGIKTREPVQYGKKVIVKR